ncbi:MAG: lipoprotein [Gammaproteobacteria bacterium]
MKIPCNRRLFFPLALVLAVSGFGAACGVKGPLYLPEETESEKEKEKQKQKDGDKTSQGEPAPARSRNS